MADLKIACPYEDCKADAPPSYTQALKRGVTSSIVKDTSYNSQSFAKPIVIPQTTTTFMNRILFPFARAYPEHLAEVGIDEAQFLAFIDGLNEAFLASPIFRILGSVGRIATFTPFPIVLGAGAGLMVVSGVAASGVSYTHTKAYVKKQNEDLFEPVGLQVKVLSTSKMLGTVNGNDEVKSLCLPALPDCDETWDPSSSSTDPRLRRMEALQGLVAPLRWNVVPADMPKNWLKRMGAWQASRSDAKAQRGHVKMCEKISRKSRKASHNGKTGKTEKAISKAERKEASVNEKIFWIVIVPSSRIK